MSSTGSGASPALPAPKQIRFVNNEGQPPAKRRRINAAYVYNSLFCASRVTVSGHSAASVAVRGRLCLIVHNVHVHLLTTFEISCRTCRKRKTRCDGKRPLCSTCTENGHECLGYGDGGEGKKERRASDANLNGDDGDDYKEGKGGNLTGRLHSNGHETYSNGSPKLRRDEPQSYFAAPKARRKGDNNGTIRNLGEYRDTTAFSDEGPSPLGMNLRPSHRSYADTTKIGALPCIRIAIEFHTSDISVPLPSSRDSSRWWYRFESIVEVLVRDRLLPVSPFHSMFQARLTIESVSQVEPRRRICLQYAFAGRTGDTRGYALIRSDRPIACQ
jgi:hypothetical protein